MSNPPPAPSHVGFPQAFGQQQYQHVQQFSQFAQPPQAAPPMNNGTPAAKPTYAANPFPFPTTSQPNGNHQYQPQYSQPPQPPAPNGHHYSGFPQAPFQNGSAAAAPPPQPLQKTPVFAPAAQYSAPPPPSQQFSAPPGPPQQFSAPPPPQQFQQPQKPSPIPGYPQPPQLQQQQMQQPQNYQQQQQMQQQFGQMNMGGPGAPNQASNQFRSDVIDLMAERNIQQYGFEDIDVSLPTQLANPSAKIDPAIFRSTLQNIPQSEELLKKKDVKNLNIIQTTNIVRCRYCRTYINPYVIFPDHRHWRCNLCTRGNDLPDDFCWDPTTKSFGDPRNRPEIQNATVEFIAPSEYMLRPPQPAVYVFLIDVSISAIQSGYLRAFSEQLIVNLDQMPGDDRTQIAFIAIDQCLHFYSFNSTKRGPSEMVVDDIDDAFVPTATSLLVPLKTYKDVIRTFIKDIPSIFSVGPTSNGNCVGSALKIVHSMIAEIGGRISIFQVSMPNLGPGALKNREEPGEKGGQNLGPATDFYKALSLECTGNQVCIDLFMFNSTYADISTLSEVAKFSTGCVYVFPNYNIAQDAYQVKRFEKTFTRYLTRKIGFEAVLRIRTTRGLSLSGFHGNFFVRSTDLLALANVNPDSALAAQVALEEKLPGHVCFQSALLYTSSKGDRRIRVHTMCLPTTGDLLQLYNHFDLKATVSYLSKIGVDRAMAGGALSDSREALVNAVVDSLGAYQKAMSRGGSMLVPRSGHLRLFPSYVLALLKHPAFSSARGLKLDERAAAMMMLRFSPLEQILSDIYPRLYRLNDLALPTCCDESSWPHPLALSFEYIQRDGIYMLEAGNAAYVYISSQADPQFLQQVFGGNYQEIHENSLIERDNDVSRRVFAFFKHVTLFRFYLGPIVIIKEHAANRELFVRRLVDDRTESTHSYIEFLQHLKREINN
ncbi:unnamed protein product [Caenorhabditis angaria]|uniref:Uncharacterized protein n=1 Tax=Caenorhabditis angaria TaxID=860376 RepID=A0A9P1N468_9PELO|nr:unnamed protein product [Caenorhabditis angaria]